MIRTRLGQVFGAAKALVTKPLASNRRKAQDAEKCRWTQENVETRGRADKARLSGLRIAGAGRQPARLRQIKLYPTWRVVCTAFFRVSGHRSQRSIPGDRKVTNRFRAQWAAEADVAVRTVIDTASLVGTNPFTQIRQTLSS